MNKEQNIDDILKLLKSSYSESESEDNAPDVSREGDDITHDELKQRLKQFMTQESYNTVSDEESDSSSYDIDDEFLAESVSLKEKAAQEAESAQEIAEEEDDGLPPFDLADEPRTADIEEAVAEVVELEIIEEYSDESFDVSEDTEDVEEIEEIFEDELIDDEYENEDAEDGVFIENGDGDIILLKAQNETEQYDDEVLSDDVLSMLGDFEEPSYVEEIIDDITEDVAQDEEASESEPTVSEPELFSDGSGQLSLFENEEREDEIASALDVTEEAVEEEDQLAMDFGDDADVEYPSEERVEDTAQISDSVLSLMFEFGDVSVANGAFERERVDSYEQRKRREARAPLDSAEAFAFDGEEYESLEQNEKLYARYMHEKYFTLLRVLGCGFFALLMFAYELAGGLGVVFDNMKYLPVYMLIDVQFLVLCTLFAWRELWSGIKKAFTFSAKRWSLVALILAFTVIYDIAIVVVGAEQFPLTFGTVCSAYIFFGLLTEYFAVCREIKSFEVYASDKKKFTFDTTPGAGSSAEKMYRGGLPQSKKVFEMKDVGFPKGYFSAVNRKESADTIVNYSITPVVLLSTLALLACVMLGTSVEISLSAFMVTLTLLSPISAFAAHTFPICRATSRLYKRECAIAGEVMANKYGECEYIVFRDMHLFKRADIHKNGIVIYDEKNSRDIIEYLDALYDAIGGPMKGVFGGISKNSHQVRLRRIARNGIEAAIDGRHSLILGEADFLKRYGIGFDATQKTSNRDGILGFAVDGKLAAKLCLRYECEPFFEMIVERMEQNGMRCAIETYDPIISGAFVAACRENKSIPINVIHKNVADYYSNRNAEAAEDTGLVVCSSRFKLVESAVWCKRLRGVLKLCGAMQIIFSAIFCGALAAAVCLGYMEYIDQYAVMLAQAMSMMPVFFAMALRFPSKDYFSLDSNKKER